MLVLLFKKMKMLKGQIVFSQMEGENLKLTIRKNDCSGNQQKGEEVIIVHKYDSTLAIGACVMVSNNSQVKNISSFSPRNPF